MTTTRSSRTTQFQMTLWWVETLVFTAVQNLRCKYVTELRGHGIDTVIKIPLDLKLAYADIGSVWLFKDNYSMQSAKLVNTSEESTYHIQKKFMRELAQESQQALHVKKCVTQNGLVSESLHLAMLLNMLSKC